MSYHYLFIGLINLLWSVQANAQLPTVATLRIVNQFGGKSLRLNEPYVTLNGDTVTFARFSYYLSNIRLTGKDGKVWQQPESYYYVDVPEEGVADLEIPLHGLPKGAYTDLAFSVGVDSLRNHSGKQADALDPDNGMFWMWETGYVFLKAEGFYHRTGGSRKAFVYHIGRDNCYQSVQLKLAKPLQANTGGNFTLEVIADARQLFGGYPSASIQLKAPVGDESVSVMGEPKAPQVARNYARMFLQRKNSRK